LIQGLMTTFAHLFILLKWQKCTPLHVRPQIQMELFANLGRVVGAGAVLPELDRIADEDNPGFLILVGAADAHWRNKNWQRAIALAGRTLSIKPTNFHALAIVTSSLGNLGNLAAARPFAARLLTAPRPNWRLTRIVCGFLAGLKCITRSGRKSYASAMARCKLEEESDAAILAWAAELLALEKAANDEVAV